MVKIADLKVGQVLTSEFEGITRDLLQILYMLMMLWQKQQG
jgi:hypothetical protein